MYGKTLCDWSKSDLEKSVAKLARLVDGPRFYCRKCARVANRAGVLCKAGELPRFCMAGEGKEWDGAIQVTGLAGD